MKRVIVASLFLMCAVMSYAAKGYAITQKFKGASNADVTVTWYVTDDKCKMKMVLGTEGKQSTPCFIPVLANGQFLTYNEGVGPAGQKVYYKIPVSKVSSESVTRLNVRKGEQTREIGGLTCEEYTVQTNTNETEMWVSKKFSPVFYKYYAFFKDYVALAGLNQERVKGFPMESVTKDATGKVVSAYSFVSVQEVELSDADFTVPAEYKSVESAK
jgi:hypothetical protein